MRLKKLGAALFVLVSLGAVLASSAFATSVTEDVKWYTGPSPGTELSGSETIYFGGVGATFTTEVGSTKYVLDVLSVECVFCKIENSGGVAVGSGEVQFVGVTVREPSGCIAPGIISTTSLSITADWMFGGGGSNYIRFVPAKGESTAFAAIPITGCALATTLIPKGSVFVESANKTGIQEVEQEVHSSAVINALAGGSLKVGTKAASLAGSVRLEMGGARFGTAFGTR